jgi:hypothetical protein
MVPVICGNITEKGIRKFFDMLAEKIFLRRRRGEMKQFKKKESGRQWEIIAAAIKIRGIHLE